MELGIKVEAVFEDGSIQQHELGSWKRSSDALNPHDLPPRFRTVQKERLFS